MGECGQRNKLGNRSSVVWSILFFILTSSLYNYILYIMIKLKINDKLFVDFLGNF